MAARVFNRSVRSDLSVFEPKAMGAEAEENDAEESPKPRARKRAAPTAQRARKSAPKAASVKAPAKPRVRKSASKAPQRTVARWAVCDNAARRVAVFEYRDRAAADAKLINLRTTRPGTYFLVLVKDLYDPPVAGATSD